MSTPLPVLVSRDVHLTSVVGIDTTLWALILEIGGQLATADWLLVGVQMVALHGVIAGRQPVRTTEDIDMVANVLARRHAIGACVDAIESAGLTASPSISGDRLHRFERHGTRVDLVVADHLPKGLRPKIKGRTAVSIVGAQRAIDRAHIVAVVLGDQRAIVPLPDILGAIVLKARAAVADSRDPSRHISDIAFLCSCPDNPIALAATIDAKERRYLNKVHLPIDTRAAPWVFLDPADRWKALEAWRLLSEPPA